MTKEEFVKIFFRVFSFNEGALYSKEFVDKLWGFFKDENLNCEEWLFYVKEYRKKIIADSQSLN